MYPADQSATLKISVLNNDIMQVAADLIVLKYADQLHGADKAVAAAIGFSSHVNPGDHIFVQAGHVAATNILFIGVGPLHDFRYERIQDFGRDAVRLAQQHGGVRHLALTIHGPGYGLDPEQSFLSMIAGIVSEWRNKDGPLAEVTIVDRSQRRCELLNNILDGRLDEFGLKRTTRRSTVAVEADRSDASASLVSNVVQFGSRAEKKPKLFVAMPFSSEYDDEFTIGFAEAAGRNSFICERLDQENFVGDIMNEIKKRIIDSHGVIALLNGHNPNVFLEIGFALAHEKPIILVAKEGVALPFDVSGHFCLLYKNIVQLRESLTKRIAALKAHPDTVRSS